MAQRKSTSTSKKKSSTAPKKSSTRSKQSAAAKAAPPAEPPKPIRREIWGVVFLCLAAFMVISYFNTDGAFIAFFANLLKGLIGWGFWLAAPAFLLIALILFFHRGRPVDLRITSALLLPILFAAIAELLLGTPQTGDFDLRVAVGEYFVSGQRLASGGVFGGLIATGLRMAFSIYGAMPLLLLLFALFLIIALRGNLSGLFKSVKNIKVPERREYKPEDYEAPVKESFQVPELVDEAPRKAVKKVERVDRRTAYTVDIPLGEDEEALSLAGPSAVSEEPYVAPAKTTRRAKVRRKAEEEPTANVKPLSTKEAAEIAGVEIVDGYRKVNMPDKSTSKPVTVTGEISDPPKKKLSRDEVQAEAQAVADAVSNAAEQSDYQFPPIELLRSSSNVAVDARDEIMLNRERLEGAIRSFGINAAIVGVTRGPTVTRYDIELEQGVKLSRVTNLAGDLALALGVVNVRIAPIPDKISTVGIEVPNKIVSTVFLRDIIESAKFQNAKSKLSFALGKDISGDAIVGNISKLPHMLIAGTTGSGKSVCMNSLILSLLYKARPDEVRLIMIDPKMVELGVYNGIPHLYVPVVTDPKKAAGALQWSVVEMLKRYRLFSEVGVRDLESYNRHCDTVGNQRLPQVVIVIDELADLMMVASKEVEESICRVAQMGRAAGMHLVIATQRPSADVITGLMKANIPSRIAFAVSSAMESRIILDQGGAEKLIGMGDMLFSPVGIGKPLRIQGAFVSDEEREDVIQFIKEGAGETQQNNEIEAFMNKATEEKGSDGGKSSKDEESAAGGYDEMLPQAVEVVLEMGSCSVSMLQRRVKLGYSRAARIVDQMEELGVVGPYEGAKPRQVIIDRAGWHDLQVQLGLASDDDMALAAEMSDTAEPYDLNE